MEFLQEPIFTVFIALVLSFIVAKIVSFAVSNSTADANSVVSSVSEGPVAEERELTVRREKGEKRVTFVDDVVVRRIDRYEGFENLDFLDDVIVDEKGVDEKSREGKSEEECSDLREVDCRDAQFEGCEKPQMPIDVKREGELIDEREEVVIGDVREEREDELIDEREGVVTGDVREERVDEEEEDDWEGIERSDLEKVFAEAVNFVEYGGKEKDDSRLAKLDSDIQMQLYGLHKVAVEGPCHEAQPMAIMVSSRGKWNAWQRLGGMSREAAMEQYIQLLSEIIPEWMHQNPVDNEIEAKDELSMDKVDGV